MYLSADKMIPRMDFKNSIKTDSKNVSMCGEEAEELRVFSKICGTFLESLYESDFK